MKSLVVNKVNKEPYIFEFEGVRYKLKCTFGVLDEINSAPENMGSIRQAFYALAVLMNDYLRRSGEDRRVSVEYLMENIDRSYAEAVFAMISEVMGTKSEEAQEPADPELDAIIEAQLPEELKNQEREKTKAPRRRADKHC